MLEYYLVVLHKIDDSCAVFDVTDGSKITEFNTRPFPHEICLSPDRKKMYIAEMGVRGVESNGHGGHTISVYDTFTMMHISTIDTAPYDRPHGIVTHENGYLFVTSESSKNLLIYDLYSENDPCGSCPFEFPGYLHGS